MSKQIKIGNLIIGGGIKPAVQSMTTVRPSDVEGTLSQINALSGVGCEIARFCVLDENDAKAVKQIKKKCKMPLVADIHFDYRLAIACIENGVDKVRLNPGNIGGADKVKLVADCLKSNGVPVRVGANTGSIEKEFYAKYGRSDKALCESALKQVKLLEENGVSDIVISVKASDVKLMVDSYRYLARLTDYPLHLGVTEAGTTATGIVKNSIGIGSLLLDGIGDTIRVSLSASPVEEVRAGRRILRSLGLEKDFVEIIACPTCGRCSWDCMAFASKIEKRVENISKPLKIAIMGCVVNGPGEAKEADLGIAGGNGNLVIFKKGEPYKKVSPLDAEKEFMKEIENCLATI